jgi:glutamyl-tRNA reductase
VRATVVGVNFRTAPLEAREQLVVAGDLLRDAHRALAQRTGQAVILSTCNRTEFYTLIDDPGQALAAMGEVLEEASGISPSDLLPLTFVYQHDDAARHLFRVACSLDSQILGESEILGQVREAFGTAVAAKTVVNPLSRLFHHALRVGKRARSETEIGRNALSVSYACVELARRTLGDLRGLSALVLGTGEAGVLAAKALLSVGVARLVVTNRSFERAGQLAQELGGEAIPFEELEDALRDADVVVSGTGASAFVVTPEMVRRAMEGRGGRPLFVIDIAVPRDVDPAVAGLPGVTLANIDDLDAVAEANRRHRQREADLVEGIIDEEVGRFLDWWGALGAVPVIKALESQADEVRRREVAKALRRLKQLSQEDRETVEAMSRALVNKLLHNPITVVKAQRNPQHLRALQELFRLHEEEE